MSVQSITVLQYYSAAVALTNESRVVLSRVAFTAVFQRALYERYNSAMAPESKLLNRISSALDHYF